MRHRPPLPWPSLFISPSFSPATACASLERQREVEEEEEEEEEDGMGNSLGGKKKIAKVMKVDGTTLKLKPPVQAAGILRDHPGYTVLDAEEVKRLGVRAEPLDPSTPLRAGKLYFLVELPRMPSHRAPRRAWSGALQVGAKERLESLKLTRRSMSDLTLPGRPSTSSVEAEETQDGGLRLKMRLPKAQVERLMQESKDAAEAAQKIMQLCAAQDAPAFATPSSSPEPPTPTVRAGRKEKRTRFLAMPDEIIA